MYCNTTEITHIRVTRMMVDINGKRNMRIFIIHRVLNRKATWRWLLCHATIARHDYVQDFKQAPPIWHQRHQRLAAMDGRLLGTGHLGKREWSPVKHHQKSHNLGWLPCHYFTTWHANTQWCPGFNRHHHPDIETGYSGRGSTHPCRHEACTNTPPPTAATSQMCRESAVSYWHTTKHGLAPAHNCHHPLAWESHLCS